MEQEKERRFHVTYGTRKKVLSCKLLEIKEKIKAHFKVEGFRLQYFDETFQDWVDCDYIDEINEEALKLNVVTDGDDDECDSTLGSPSYSKGSTVDSDDLLEQSAATGTDLEASSDEEQFLPWPTKFEIHASDIRKDIRSDLVKGSPINSRMRAALIQSTYDKISQYTVYPTSDQYTIASRAIIKTFPHFATKTPLCEPHDAIKNALRDKFRNERRHMSTDIVVKKRKKIKKEKHCDSGSSSCVPEGETEETMQDHIKTLKNEAGKKKQDVKKIAALMTITFVKRRSLILEKNTIPEIRDSYPTLFKAEMILQDFATIVNWHNVKQVFYQNLDIISKKIINLRTHTKNSLQFLVDYKCFMEQTQSEESKTNARRTAALYILPSLLKEDKNYLMIDSDEDVTSDDMIVTPVACYQGQPLAAESSFAIITENEECCKSQTFPEAILLVLACYFVFDIKYHTKVKGTLTFIQNALLDVKDKGKLPQKIVTLVTKLQ